VHFIVVPAGMVVAIGITAYFTLRRGAALKVFIAILGETFMLFLATTMDLFDCISDTVVWFQLYGKEGKEDFLIWYSLFMGCGLLMFVAMSYWNVKRILNIIGTKPDLKELTARTWRREVKYKQSKKSGTQITPVSEGLKAAIDLVGEGNLDPSNESQSDGVKKFMAAAFEAHKYETTMNHLMALIGLLAFEDLPMAIMSAILLAETISKTSLNSNSGPGKNGCEDLDDLTEEEILEREKEEDEDSQFMMIVLGSFTLSCLLLSSKLVAIANLPKQKRMAEHLHHVSVKLLMDIDTTGPPADAGDSVLTKMVRRFSRSASHSTDIA